MVLLNQTVESADLHAVSHAIHLRMVDVELDHEFLPYITDLIASQTVQVNYTIHAFLPFDTIISFDHVLILKMSWRCNLKWVWDPDMTLGPCHFANEVRPVAELRNTAQHVDLLAENSLVSYLKNKLIIFCEKF